MKRAIVGLTMALILVPHVAFAAWWNPLTWFDDWAFFRADDTKEQVLEERVKELEERLADVTSQQAATTTATATATTTPSDDEEKETSQEFQPSVPVSSQSASPAETLPQKQATDACLNIEGIQSTVPSGFTSQAGICSVEKKEDRCPNLEGVQETIPKNRVFYRNTSECLTESQINQIEEKKTQAQAKEENCEDAKDEAVKIAQQKEDAWIEHQTILTEIEKNEEGKLRSAIQDEIQKENARYNALVKSLNAQLDIANYEVQQYCG